VSQLNLKSFQARQADVDYVFVSATLCLNSESKRHGNTCTRWSQVPLPRLSQRACQTQSHHPVVLEMSTRGVHSCSLSAAASISFSAEVATSETNTDRRVPASQWPASLFVSETMRHHEAGLAEPPYSWQTGNRSMVCSLATPASWHSARCAFPGNHLASMLDASGMC
jgi:hypothetical protein